MFPERPNNEKKFDDFPDNPDLYGKMTDPNPLSLGPPQHPSVPTNQAPYLGNFAPPGTLPPIGSPTSPMYGIDGQGSDLMVRPQKGNQKIQGDTDIMYAKGQIPPPPGYDNNMKNGNNGGRPFNPLNPNNDHFIPFNNPNGGRPFNHLKTNNDPFIPSNNPNERRPYDPHNPSFEDEFGGPGMGGPGFGGPRMGGPGFGGPGMGGPGFGGSGFGGNFI